MGSETLPSACYILSDESSILFYYTSQGYNYRIPHSQKKEVDKQVDKLFKNKTIEPLVSEYNSPLLIVPKKSLPSSTDKRWRLVID